MEIEPNILACFSGDYGHWDGIAQEDFIKDAATRCWV
jgi:hypothetical protein